MLKKRLKRYQLGGMFRNAQWANSEYVPQFVGSNFDELNRIGSVLDERANKNRETADRVFISLAQDRILQNDEGIRKDLYKSIYGQIDEMAKSDKGFENSTALVSKLAKDYLSNQSRLKAVQNFEKAEKFNELKLQYGQDAINRGDDPSTFSTLYTDEQGNQKTRDFNLAVEPRADYSRKMQELIGKVASDGYIINPYGVKVNIDKDTQATLAAYGRGERVSQEKVKGLVKQLIPTYLASKEGEQDEFRLKNIEQPSDGVSPEEDIRRRFESVAMPQVRDDKALSYTALNVTPRESAAKKANPFDTGAIVANFRPSTGVRNPFIKGDSFKSGSYGTGALGMPTDAQQQAYRSAYQNLLKKHNVNLSSRSPSYLGTTPAGYTKEFLADEKKLQQDFERFGDAFSFIQYTRDNPKMVDKIMPYLTYDPAFSGMVRADGTLNEEAYVRLPQDKRQLLEKEFESLENQVTNNLSGFSYPTMLVGDKDRRLQKEEELGLGANTRELPGLNGLQSLVYYDLNDPEKKLSFNQIVDVPSSGSDQIELKKNISLEDWTLPADPAKNMGYMINIGGKKYFAEETANYSKPMTDRIRPLLRAGADPGYDNLSPKSNKNPNGFESIDLFGTGQQAPVYAYSVEDDGGVYATSLANGGVNFVEQADGFKRLQPRTSGVFITREQAEALQEVLPVKGLSLPPVIQKDQNGNSIDTGTYVIPFETYLQLWELMYNPDRTKQKFENEN